MKTRRAGLLLLFSLIGVILTVVSCATPTRTLVMPPEIPGATFTGSETCAQCHANQHKNFAGSDHARLKAHGDHATNVGCESCHGPASVHISSGGAARTILNPRRSPETCYQCHVDKRGSFSLTHSHPLIEGRVSCADCHDPHEGRAAPGGATSLASADQTCFKCHTVQRGPFVFEHEALREGCQTCHSPHGSVNQKMLTERNQLLCLKCHFQTQTAPGKLFIGGHEHTDDVSRGTCWSAGCHEAVHGSQISNSLRF
jgi:predicted CXXCH cytochrome family protein